MDPMEPLEHPPSPGPDEEEILSPVDSDELLSEQQLRELYDSEEIDRFLNLFSAYVTEVQVRGEPAVSDISTKIEETETDWVDIDTTISSKPDSGPRKSLSEEIAFRYLVPILPPEPLPPPNFTLGRLRLTTQRLYLSVLPYAPFFQRLVRLATWDDSKTSTAYCLLFWTLWYYNMILPTIFFRIFYALIRRRIFPYPTLQELKERRAEVIKASEFGSEVQERLAASNLGIKEAWRLFKVFNKSKKAKAKGFAHDKAKETGIITSDPDQDIPDARPDQPTVLDDPEGGEEERDMKRVLLQVCAEIADLHERVKNIFIWRRPATSKLYGVVLLFLTLITMVVPAKYLAKTIYFVGGLLFWHITPIIAALPPNERARLPPAFADSLTDADYAMQLISQRVAAGLDVKPKSRKARKAQSRNTSANVSTADLASTSTSDLGNTANSPDKEKIDWKKWGERAAVSKALMRGNSRDPLSPVVSSTAGESAPISATHTFPCQHTTSPGLITLTSTTVYFTPLMSVKPTVTIQIADIRGVKKTGILKGLTIRHASPETASICEEKFAWVGGRQELFTLLIGSSSNDKKWLRA